MQAVGFKHKNISMSDVMKLLTYFELVSTVYLGLCIELTLSQVQFICYLYLYYIIFEHEDILCKYLKLRGSALIKGNLDAHLKERDIKRWIFRNIKEWKNSTCWLVLVVIVKLWFSVLSNLETLIVNHPRITNDVALSNLWMPLKCTVKIGITTQNMP